MNQRRFQISDILVAFSFQLDPSGKPRGLGVTYRPSFQESHLDYLGGQFSLTQDQARDLWPQLETLTSVFQAHAPGGDLVFRGDTIPFGSTILSVRCDEESSTLQVRVRNTHLDVKVKHEDLSLAQRQLFENVLQSIRSLAWEDLRTALGAAPRSGREAVFISYRKGSQSERFAEAVAMRLHQEGLTPWLDRWEVVAGDSLSGKIDEALERSFAFVPILTGDYREGKWATEELESALAKRATEGYRIVPILYEHCAIPQLLKSTVYVDCKDHSEEAFERQMRELVEGIYRLTSNPYR